MTQEAVIRDFRRLAVSDVNTHVTCRLCHGYLIDATTIKQCIHSFCRSCIVRHLQSHKDCPVCHVTVIVPGTDREKLSSVLRPDRILQALTYKIIPGLYKKEERLRLTFAESHPSESTECRSTKVVRRRRPIISPDDKISLCLSNPSMESRYLLCPAAMTVGAVKQFIAVKFSLNQADQMVLLCISDNILEDQQTLMDVIYIEKWNQEACLVLDYDVVCRQYTSTVTSSESLITSDVSAYVNTSLAISTAPSSESFATNDDVPTIQNESTSMVSTPPKTSTVCSSPTLCQFDGISGGTIATPSESKIKRRVGSALATSSESKIKIRNSSALATSSESIISGTMNPSSIHSSPVKTQANSAALLTQTTVAYTGVSSPSRTPSSTSVKSFPRTPACPTVPSASMTPSCLTVAPKIVLTTEGQPASHFPTVKRNNSSPLKSDGQKRHCPTSRPYSSTSLNSSTSLWTTCARSSASPRVSTNSLSPRVADFNVPPSPSVTSSKLSPPKGTFSTASSSSPRVTECNIPSSPKVTSLNSSPQKVASLKSPSPKMTSMNGPTSPKNTSLILSPSKVTSLSRSPGKITSFENSPSNNFLNNCHEAYGDLPTAIEEPKCKFTKLAESNDDSSQNGLSPNKSLIGLSPSKSLIGFSSEKSQNGLSPDKTQNGLSPDKSLNVLSSNNSLPQSSLECSRSDGLTISASVTVVINRGPTQQQQLDQQLQQQQQLQEQLPNAESDSSAVTKAKRKQRSLEAIVSALRPKPISSPLVGVGGSNKSMTRSPVSRRQGMPSSADNTTSTFDQVNPLHEQNYKLQNASPLEEPLRCMKSSPSNSNITKQETSKTSGKRHFHNDDLSMNGSKVSASVPPIKRLKQMAASPVSYLPRAVTSVVSNQRGAHGIGLYSGALTEHLTRFTTLQQQQQQQQQQQLNYINSLRAPTAGNINRAGNTNNNNTNAFDSCHSGGRLPTSSQNSVRPPFWFGNNASAMSQQFLQQHQFQQMMLRQQQAVQQRSPATTPSPALSTGSSSSTRSSSQPGRGVNMTPVHPAFALPNGYDAPIELTTQQTRERKEMNDRPSTKLSRSHATITALLQRK